jgi:hypothetical protein
VARGRVGDADARIASRPYDISVGACSVVRPYGVFVDRANDFVGGANDFVGRVILCA